MHKSVRCAAPQRRHRRQCEHPMSLRCPAPIWRYGSYHEQGQRRGRTWKMCMPVLLQPLDVADASKTAIPVRCPEVARLVGGLPAGRTLTADRLGVVVVMPRSPLRGSRFAPPTRRPTFTSSSVSPPWRTTGTLPPRSGASPPGVATPVPRSWDMEAARFPGAQSGGTRQAHQGMAHLMSSAPVLARRPSQ